MPEISDIKIPRSRWRLALGLVFCLVGVAIGVLCIVNPQSFNGDYLLLIRTLGALLILVFGFLAVCVIKWLFNAKPGLVIDADGFIDNTAALNLGRVWWRDVQGLGEWSFGGQKVVVFLLHDPQCFIESYAAERQRKAMLMNMQSCGSPATLSAMMLKISHKQLYALLQEQYAAYLKRAQN